MERGGKTRRQRKQRYTRKQQEMTEDGDDTTGTDSDREEEHMESQAAMLIRTGLKDIVKEIQDFKTEMKAEFTAFKEEIKKEMKEELEDLKKDVNQRLTETTTELATQDKRLAEAEMRIEEMETWNIEAKEALLQSMKQQKILQDKLTDQEGRNRRNNIRIFGLKEGTEGSSVAQFIEQLLKQELPLPINMVLQIQWAHRALMPKPDADKPPRSIVVNFLQYTVKETVLKEAWKKKIHYQNQPLFFDHDYVAEVIRKRKEYNGIKKALKEKGIRFQTPLTKIRIHWETGPRTYESAQEAAEELHRRGIMAESPRRGAARTGTEERLQQALPWQLTGNPEDTAARIKKKLQDFQRR